MNQSVNELINYETVCRTAPATPGLLKIYTYFKVQYPFRKKNTIMFLVPFP